MGTQPTQYHPLEQPDELDHRDKEDGMGAYLMMFAALAAGLPLPIINLVAAAIYYYTMRGKKRFVRFHALQSFWSQTFTSVLNIALVAITLRMFINGWRFDFGNQAYLMFLASMVIANLIYVGFSIVAAIKAYHGKVYYFLFVGPMCYRYIYKVRPTDGKDNTLSHINKPPF